MAQLHDRLLQTVRKHILAGRPREFSMEEDGTIFLTHRLCVPQKAAIKIVILREAHRAPYMEQLGETKKYQDLKQIFWWKRIVVDYCKICGFMWYLSESES